MTDRKLRFWLICLVLILILIVGFFYVVSRPRTANAPTTSISLASVLNAPATAIHNDEKYYTVDGEYPSTTPLAGTAGIQADSAARAIMQQFVTTAISDFKKESIDPLSPSDISYQGLGEDGRKYSLNIEYTATSSPTTVSYVFTVTTDTMGAHPNSTYQTFTFDLKTGSHLSLADLFVPGSNYLSILSTATRADLPRIIGDDADTSFINPGTEATGDNFSNFSLSNGNLNLIFPPYQVGPYALGTIIDPIPLSRLSSIIKAGFN